MGITASAVCTIRACWLVSPTVALSSNAVPVFINGLCIPAGRSPREQTHELGEITMANNVLRRQRMSDPKMKAIPLYERELRKRVLAYNKKWCRTSKRLKGKPSK